MAGNKGAGRGAGRGAGAQSGAEEQPPTSAAAAPVASGDRPDDVEDIIPPAGGPGDSSSSDAEDEAADGDAGAARAAARAAAREEASLPADFSPEESSGIPVAHVVGSTRCRGATQAHCDGSTLLLIRPDVNAIYEPATHTHNAVEVLLPDGTPSKPRERLLFAVQHSGLALTRGVLNYIEYELNVAPREVDDSTDAAPGTYKSLDRSTVYDIGPVAEEELSGDGAYANALLARCLRMSAVTLRKAVDFLDCQIDVYTAPYEPGADPLLLERGEHGWAQALGMHGETPTNAAGAWRLALRKKMDDTTAHHALKQRGAQLAGAALRRASGEGPSGSVAPRRSGVRSPAPVARGATGAARYNAGVRPPGSGDRRAGAVPAPRAPAAAPAPANRS